MRKLVLGLIAATIVLFIVAGGILGSYLGEHLGGKEAWIRWKAERIEKGDRFDWRELSPCEVPDDENFAKAPIVAGAVLGKDLDPSFKALAPPLKEDAIGDWRCGRRENLASHAAEYKSQDLLQTLKLHASALHELDLASRRPKSRLPINYAEYETPGLLGFRGAARVMRIRALANLSKGNSELALADVMTNIRIANHLKAEPSLLASLLRTSILRTTMQVIWEGLVDHRWDDRQLAVLQAELLNIDLLSSARLSWEGERMMAIDTFTNTAEGRPLPLGLQFEEGRREPLKLGRLGKGWWYRNLLEIDHFYANSLLDVFDPKAHRVYPSRFISGIAWEKRLKHRIDLAPGRIAIPALSGQVILISRIQSALDQAVVVCALERYRLARAAYPVSLTELVPAYLDHEPVDVPSGSGLLYKRFGESFTLYSPGWDVRDDGGRLVWTKEAKPSPDPEKGDWVWFTTAQNGNH